MRFFGVIKTDFLRSWSIRQRRGSTAIAEPQTPVSPPSEAWSIYLSAEVCPLRAFISAMVEQDVKHLTITGTAPEQDLQEAWLNIYSAFCQLTGGIQISALIRRSTAINALSSRIDRITTLLEAAKCIISEELCAALKEEGFAVDAQADDETYGRQIEAAVSRLKSDVLRLQGMIAENPKAQDGKEEPATREMFAMNLLEISKHEGYPVRDDITVMQYGLHIKRLRTHIESLTKQAKTAKNGSR